MNAEESFVLCGIFSSVKKIKLWNVLFERTKQIESPQMLQGVLQFWMRLLAVRNYTLFYAGLVFLF